VLQNDITNVLDLNFSAELDHFGKHAVVDLIPNGANIVVTEANKLEYVQLISQHRMSTAIQVCLTLLILFGSIGRIGISGEVSSTPAVSPRPPNPSHTSVARTQGYTYAAQSLSHECSPYPGLHVRCPIPLTRV
jgi:hypothetical protein